MGFERGGTGLAWGEGWLVGLPRGCRRGGGAGAGGLDFLFESLVGGGVVSEGGGGGCG